MCHLGEMDLTRQGLATFCEGKCTQECCRSPCWRQLVGLTDRSFPDGGPCICALACVHDIVSMFDLQHFLPVEPYLNKRLVLFWEPEAVNFLVLPHKVC